LEVYRADLKTVSTGERAFISFKAAAHSPHCTVHSSAQSEGGPQCTIPPEEVSEAFVHQRVLEFFQLLASAHR
jgi:hypothetical protein